MAPRSKPPSRQERRLNGAPPRATSLDKGNGRATHGPAAESKSGSERDAERRSKGGIEGLIGRRVAAATEHALDGPEGKIPLGQVSRLVWRLGLR